MNKFISSVMALSGVLGVCAQAPQQVELDGFNFELYTNYEGEHYAKVTGLSEFPDGGELVIPAAITFEKQCFPVKKIGKEAFRGYMALTSVTIPSGIEYIGKYAFADCMSLRNVTYQASDPVECDESVFSGYDTYATVTLTVLPEAMDKIDSTVPWCLFNYISDDEFLGMAEESEDGLLYGLYKSGDDTYALLEGASGQIGETLTVAASMKCKGKVYPVYGIGAKAFSGTYGLREVVISEGVRSIGAAAFRDCRHLSSITLPAGIEEIREFAFNGCGSLSAVNYPVSQPVACNENVFSVSVYGSATLNVGDGGLQNAMDTDPWGRFLIIMAGKYCGKTKDMWGFVYDLYNDKEGEPSAVLVGYEPDEYVDTDMVLVPSNVIGAFTNYTVTAIGNEAMQGNGEMCGLQLPSTVTVIGRGAFRDCNSLNMLILPESIEKIGEYAFRGCNALYEVSIPASVERIGDYAFAACQGLYAVSVEDGNENYVSFDGVLFDKDMTTLLQMPAGQTGVYVVPGSVTAIGTGAFFLCEGLSDIELPCDLKSIGEWAFYDCAGLTSVTLPGSLEEIGNCAFYYCNGLEEIEYATEDPIECLSTVFSWDTYQKATLYIGVDGVDKAKEISPWMYFGNNIQARSFHDVGAVEDIPVADAPVEIYDLRGMKLSGNFDSLAPGIYVIRQGEIVRKVRKM